MAMAHRWWHGIGLFVVAAFLLGGCHKKAAVSQTAEGADGAFRVLQVTPQGELPATVKYPSIQIQFSKPVVALEKLGEASNKSDIVSISPALDGVFRWYGTSLLSFEARTETVPQKEYTIKISAKTTSIGGEKISGPLEYQFHPEELQLISVVPGYGEVKDGNYVDSDDVPPLVAKDILVTFNFPVNVNMLAKELRVLWGSDGIPHPFTAEQEGSNSLRLTLQDAPYENEQVEIMLPPGSMADEGCYKTTAASFVSFHTLRPFAVKNYDDDPGYYWEERYSNPVMITFTALLASGSEAEVARHITTSLGTPVTADNVVIDGKMLLVHGLPVSFGASYTLSIDEGLADVYGRTLPEPATYSIEVPDARSFAYFKDYGSNILEAQFAPKLVFQHQNIKEGSSYTVRAVANATGKKVSDIDKTVTLLPSAIPQNIKVLEAVDLKPFLQEVGGGEYHGAISFDADMVYQYKITDWETQEKQLKTAHRENSQLVQVTDLGVTARYGYNRAAVLVTSLKTGRPVGDAQVTVYAVNDVNSDFQKHVITDVHTPLGSARTNSSGFALVEFPQDRIHSLSHSQSIYIEAKTADDRVIFAPSSHNMWYAGVYNTDSPRNAENTQMVAFLFTDRGLYKPGETVTFRGIDRNLTGGDYAPYIGSFHLKLTDGSWRSETYYEATGATSENGTFWGKFTLPDDIKPGSYTIVYERAVPGRENTQRRSCGIQVQFFERLRFEVNSSIPQITYYSGDDVSADVQAAYLGGGSLAGSPYYAYWSRSKGYFNPAQFSDYDFGPIQGYDGRTSLDTEDGVLNAEGKASLTQKTGGEKIVGTPYEYRVEARVTDSGNQEISTVASVKVHPARFYIGVRRKNAAGFPKKGEQVSFEYVCITPEGELPSAQDLPASKQLKAELLREDWKEVQQVAWNGQINTRYERQMVTEEEKTVAFAVSTKATELSMVPPKGGAYLLRLSAKDSRGRDVVSEIRFYVTSSDWYWTNRNDAQEITMTTGKDQYEVGDTAQILMQSPLPKGTYLLTVEREGMVSQELRQIDAPTTVLSVPITEQFIPVMYVTLSSYSIRSGAPQNDFNTPDIDKPKGYFGVAVLNVSPTPKRFDIAVKMDKASYRPGDTATITVHASKSGRSLPMAEVTLMAVDRGVIDLINYHVPDPVAYFYNVDLFPDCLVGGDSRSLLMDPVTYEIKNLVGGDNDNGGDKLQERKNFDPTALFVPSLITDENGDASYTFTVPDSLTAYRVTAVGVNTNNFALTEDEMRVANPVSVRSVLPRELRLSDKGEVGVTVSNIDGAAHELSVSLSVTPGVEKASGEQNDEDVQRQAGNAKIEGEVSKRLSVRAGATEPLFFTIQATQAGWITLEYMVRSDVVNERIVLPLQIEKPYIYETVTTVGDVRSDSDKGSATVEEKIKLPSGAEDGRGELYVQLDPTRLGILREAISYVFHYPYGCLEQRSSAVLPLIAFDKYIKLFGLESEVKNPHAVVRKEINSWASSQLASGGFPYWPGGSYDNPSVSMRIAEIVGLAKKNGVSIKGIDTDSLAEYLVSHGNRCLAGEGSGYEAAHAYYAASCLGATVSEASLNKILSDKAVGAEAMALCGLTYMNMGDKGNAKAVGDVLRRSIQLTTRGASIQSGNDSPYAWFFFTDESEKFALCLELFTSIDATADINQHLVYELLQLQRAGHGYWQSTAATARVLQALNAYIKTNKLEDLHFSAEVLLQDASLLTGQFKGAAAEAVDTRYALQDAPLASLPRDKDLSLQFTKDGRGTLYYTASLKYALPTAEQTARDEGLCIFTEITDVKTGEVVSGDALVSGKVYREKVFVSTTRNREYVAVRAPVPAGCEIMNAAFVTTGSYADDAPFEEQDDDDWYGDFQRQYTHGLSYQGIYDAEVQYFWDYFPAGHQQVEFLFRAARPGEYNTPSATAECMYQEEIFGRSKGKVWKVQ